MTAIASAISTWRVRHEGSPQSIDNLSPQDVVTGLEEGRWETIDEVRGPNDMTWVPIENHPQFEEAAADLEPAPPRDLDDHSHVDMNALIDVCLVLLVFFILTTSYAALTKQLDAPDMSANDEARKKPTPIKDALKTMILVSVTMEKGVPVYRVEGKAVPPESLAAECSKYVRTSGRTILLLEHDRAVPHKCVVKVHDAAKGAGMTKVVVALPPPG